MKRRKLPPILRAEGLRLLEMGENDEGIYLKFIVETTETMEGEERVVREITLLMQGDGPLRWTYQYSIYDKETNTVTTYRGRTGNPNRDRVISVRGA